VTADQMADALRALGWTCAPPEPAAPTRRARVERELADTLFGLWRAGALGELALRTAAPRHTFRVGVLAETYADFAGWLLRAPVEARQVAWRLIGNAAPQSVGAGTPDVWRALTDPDADALAGWLDAPDSVTQE
jgi:hypothetical protein